MLLLSLAVLLALPACDENEGPDENGDDETLGDSDSEDSDSEDTQVDSVGIDSRGDTDDEPAGETDELLGCGEIDNGAECMDDPLCTSVFGQRLVEDGAGGLCTSPDETFVGCVSSDQLCPGGRKTVCADEDMWQISGCIPDKVSVCEAPGEIGEGCE